MTTMDGHDSPFLSARQVAARLGVSELTIRRRIKSGELPAVRLGHGRAVRVRSDDLEAALRPVRPRDPEAA
jgi:excisionase family DNA binding protein